MAHTKSDKVKIALIGLVSLAVTGFGAQYSLMMNNYTIDTRQTMRDIKKNQGEQIRMAGEQMLLTQKLTQIVHLFRKHEMKDEKKYEKFNKSVEKIEREIQMIKLKQGDMTIIKSELDRLGKEVDKLKKISN